MNPTEGNLMRESRLRIITVRSSGTKLKKIFMLKILPVLIQEQRTYQQSQDQEP